MTNNPKQKKIIFFIPSLEAGGGERIVSEISLNLPKNFNPIIVILRNIIFYPYKGKLLSLNIPHKNNPFLKLYYFIVTWIKFRKIVKKENPDYTMSLGNLPHIINILSGKNSIVRIGNLQSKNYNGIKKILFKYLMRILFKKTERIVIISKGLKKDLTENFDVPEVKMKLIYNPIDIKKIQKLSKEPIEKKYKKIFEHPVIFNLGRLSEQKNQHQLIKAFKKIKKEYPDLKLVILGDGPLKNNILNLISELNLKNDVYLLGVQKNPFKFLSKSKLCVFSSLWEGFGIIITEALACNIPIISTDCDSGPRDILAPETNPYHKTTTIEYAKYGILVPIDNERILSEAMIKILSDKNLYKQYKERSLERAYYFDIKKIIKDYASL